MKNALAIIMAGLIWLCAAFKPVEPPALLSCTTIPLVKDVTSTPFTSDGSECVHKSIKNNSTNVASSVSVTVTYSDGTKTSFALGPGQSSEVNCYVTRVDATETGSATGSIDWCTQ